MQELLLKMWKQIKIGLAGILQSLGYFLVLFLVLSMFDSKDIIKIYSVESIYLIFDSLQMCVVRGKFYFKDRDTKGMTVLYFVSIVVIVAGIFRETLLKNRGRGFSVTRIYILKHGLRALLLILSNSFLVYLFSMWFEVLLHYAFITYLYIKECNKYNLRYKKFKISSLWDGNMSYKYYY